MLRSSNIAIKFTDKKESIDYHGVTAADVTDMIENCSHFIAVEISEGRELAVKDIFASDPYIRFAVVPRGCVVMPKKGKHFKSHYVTQSLNPTWNYMRVTQLPGTEEINDKDILIEIWDKDTGRSDDFMGRISIDISEVMNNKPTWYELQKRKEKESISGEIRVAVEVLPAQECKRMMQETRTSFVPLFHWKYHMRMNYQAETPSDEVPEILRPTGGQAAWEEMIKESLLQESKNMPIYVFNAYAALPPGSILGGSVKVISLARATIETFFCRIYVTGFHKGNNLLECDSLMRDGSVKQCYIKFIPMQFGAKGENAASKLIMMIIGDRFLLRGPCFVDNTTRSVAMYIPKSDKFNYLPALPRTDTKPTEPINGNIRAWVSSLTEATQPIGELFTCFSKIFTIQEESETEHQKKCKEIKKLDDDSEPEKNCESTSNSLSESTEDIQVTPQKVKKKKRKSKKTNKD